jgi:hypothetical protein
LVNVKPVPDSERGRREGHAFGSLSDNRNCASFMSVA